MSTEEGKPERKPRSKALQVILGCGRIGYAVAKELKEDGLDVLIVDIDAKKVELLNEEGFIAYIGDISDPEVISKVLNEGEPETVFILSNNSDVNLKAVENAKKLVPNAHLVVRAIAPTDKEDLKGVDVDIVLAVPDITAKMVIGHLERVRSLRRSKKLAATIEEIKELNKEGKLGIVIHDSPDSDAIASALALKQIARHVGVPADILYRGEIGHHVNRAFVNILGIEMRRIMNPEELKEYTKLALVDATVPGANNPLPPDGKVHIVIDHHAVNDKKKLDAEFLDAHTEDGATSTTMTRYLRDLEVPVDKVLATALLYGIRSDTNAFKRETNQSDFFAAAFLHMKADKDLLERIENPPMSTEMLNVVGQAILHKRIKGSYLITNVGVVANRDAIPQAADYLLNLEGISTVVVIGLYEDKIIVSGRSKDIRINIGDAFARAFGSIGSAGGHATMAAAQIPLGIFSGLKDKDTIVQLVDDAVSKRFLSVLQEEKSG